MAFFKQKFQVEAKHQSSYIVRKLQKYNESPNLFERQIKFGDFVIFLGPSTNVNFKWNDKKRKLVTIPVKVHTF